MSALEEIRRRFQEDHFATDAAGAQIDCAEPGRAVCSLTLEEKHMNGIGVPMGGAVFTLADFACAVAANGYCEKATVSQNASITFLAPAKGKRLIADCALCGGRERRAGNLCGSRRHQQLYRAISIERRIQKGGTLSW